MKLNTILLVITILATNNIIAQRAFSGRITYKIQYEDSETTNPENNDLPSTMTVSLRENLSKTELTTTMGSHIIIGDADEQSTIILINLGESKFYVKNTKEEREKSLADSPPIFLKYTNETKNIAGYNCKKVEIIQGEKNIEAYYTEEIKIEKPNWQTEFKDINGVLLEYTQISDEIKTRYIATEIIKEKINKKEFIVPNEYRLITKEELTEALKEKSDRQ